MCLIRLVVARLDWVLVLGRGPDESLEHNVLARARGAQPKAHQACACLATVATIFLPASAR